MVTYLVILFLLFVNFWGLKPLGSLSNDINILLILAMLLYGYCRYGKKREYIQINGRYKYLMWISIGILISTIPTMIYYNQDITTSLIIYRSQIILLTIPVLFKISPSVENVTRALFIFAVFMFIANILIISNTNLFVISEEAVMRYELDPEANKLRATRGIGLLIIPLYYYLQKLIDKFNIKIFARIVFILFVIYIAENRSTLFPATILTLYSFTRIKSKYKPVIIAMIAVMAVIVFTKTAETWESLIVETQENLEDNDSNRNKAFLYFTTFGQPSWITYLLGNGIISTSVSNYTIMLKENGIFYSDVGLIGYWYNFGIIPIIAMFFMFFRILKSKYQTYCIKLMVVHILICSVTTSYYYTQGHLLQFMLLYYMFYYNQYRTEQKFQAIKQTS